MIGCRNFHTQLRHNYQDHYSFIKDFQMILCTVLGEEDGVCRGNYLESEVKGTRFTVNERAVSTVHHQSISRYTAGGL